MEIPDPLVRRHKAPTRTMAALALAGLLAMSSGAEAQKNSGPLLPVAPVSPIPPTPVRPSAPRATPPVSQPGQAGQGGTNPDADRLARTLPLPPDQRELRDAVPPDRAGTERRLGLREPRGPATDMRGRTPSPREIVDALAPR